MAVRRPTSDGVTLGIDVGTSAVKVLAMSLRGDVIAHSSAPLAMATPRPGWAEQDPESWWLATRSAINAVIAQLAGTPVLCVGLSGQMHSSVFLDRTGTVVRPALLWCDARTTDECAALTREIGEDNLRGWTANAALEGFTLPKVLWLRKHEPEHFARVAKILLPKDFIRYRLTGVLATEPSDASGTLMYDVAHDRWSAEMLAAVRIDRTLLPDVGESAGVLSRITPSVARELGIAPGAPVVGGGADNACGALGVGVVSPGETVASWGTSGTLVAPVDRPLVDPELRLHTFRHAAPGIWYVMGVILSAGGAFNWFQQELARDLGTDADARSRLDEEAMSVAPGADGVTFLPYLQGERTPHRDGDARGAFVGLSLAHRRRHLARAVLEGVTFAMRDSVELLRAMGIPIGTLLLTGGGSRSTFLRQMQADVFGLPITTSARADGPAYGAALLAATGIGVFPDILAAVDATRERGAALAPDVGVHRAYDLPYARFRALYPALRAARASTVHSSGA